MYLEILDSCLMTGLYNFNTSAAQFPRESVVDCKNFPCCKWFTFSSVVF